MLTYGDASYGYSANGSLKYKIVGSDTTFYTYDLLGNLVSVLLPDDTFIEYIIDGQNRRVGKKVNDVFQKGWLYQDQLNPVIELDENGDPAIGFVYGTKGHVPDFMVTSTTSYRIITDHLGSVRLVVNAVTGDVVQQLEYDEFGNVIVDTNPGFQPFGYAGGLYDVQTGLVRFGARDYDAETGRWTAKDPIRFRGKSYNFYTYASSDPINWIDPSGLSKLVFNRSSGSLEVWPDDEMGPPQVFPAGNNTVNPNGDPLEPESHGPVPNGLFQMGGFIETGGDPCSSFGSGFIPIILPKNESGANRTGVGLHAGRTDNGGVNHLTLGCIRTTEAALDVLRNDPPTQILVED